VRRPKSWLLLEQQTRVRCFEEKFYPPKI